MRPFIAGPIFRSTARLAVALCSLALAACGGNSASPLPRHSTAPQSGAIPNYVPPVYLSSDWPEFRRDDQRTGNNPGQTLITKANVATLAPKWISDTPGGMFASPIIFNGNVYKADLGGHFLQLNEATGQTGWTYYPGPGDSFVGSPVYNNGVLYEGSTKGAFYAFDAATGAVKINYPVSITNASILSSALVAGGLVYVGITNADQDDKLCLTRDQFVAFSPTSPTMVNSLSITPAGSTGPGMWASPMIDPQGFAYLGIGNSCSGPPLQVADAVLKVGPITMKVNWDEPGPPDEHDLDFGATPVYVGGMIVDGSKDGNVYAFMASTGAKVWKTNAGIASGSVIGSPATDGMHIFVPFVHAGTGGAIVALNLDGSVEWTLLTEVDSHNFGVLSAPAVSQGMVFVGYTEAGCTTGPCNGISALDANTGQVLWRYKTMHSIYAGPAIVDGGLFVGEFDGTSVYCFTPNGL